MKVKSYFFPETIPVKVAVLPLMVIPTVSSEQVISVRSKSESDGFIQVITGSKLLFTIAIPVTAPGPVVSEPAGTTEPLVILGPEIFLNLRI